MQHIPYRELHQTLKRILIKYQFSAQCADLSARLFAETSLDGIASHGLYQIFIAIDIEKNKTIDSDHIINTILDYIKSAGTDHPKQKIFYPGEQTLIRRQENIRAGIPVDDYSWQQILDMLS